MSRIAKSDVHQALERAAQNIINARGNDPIVSRKDIQEAVAKMPPGKEAALTAHFFRYIDARDAKPGARVTKRDVDRALVYAKKHIIDKYDVNNNGLSREEVAKMSWLGKLAVNYARELRATRLGQAAPPAPTGPTAPAGPTAAGTSSSPLGQSIAAAGRLADGSELTFMSESDYPYVFVEAAHPGMPLDGGKIMATFGSHMQGDVFQGEQNGLRDLAVEVSSPADTAGFLRDFGKLHDPDDEWSVDVSRATTAVKKLLTDNLADLTLIKVGPKAADGSLQSDAGLYNYLLLGTAQDGKLAGVSFGSVET
jgi:hypothetical protein